MAKEKCQPCILRKHFERKSFLLLELLEQTRLRLSGLAVGQASCPCPPKRHTALCELLLSMGKLWEARESSSLSKDLEESLVFHFIRDN